VFVTPTWTVGHDLGARPAQNAFATQGTFG
jgi:hypothetical protein